ncbi:MAG: hypothetical protein KatS3mg057_1212 [Herpetosiphonaceae bacterium]|nr:MAG: hypothetical protein KatS3mg057_1212 [Herpetosiphonaceae bacterium]
MDLFSPEHNRSRWFERARQGAVAAGRRGLLMAARFRTYGASLYSAILRSQFAARARDNQILLLGLALLLITIIMAHFASGGGGDQLGGGINETPTLSALVGRTTSTPERKTSTTIPTSKSYPDPVGVATPSEGLPTSPPAQTPRATAVGSNYPGPDEPLPSPVGSPPGPFVTQPALSPSPRSQAPTQVFPTFPPPPTRRVVQPTQPSGGGYPPPSEEPEPQETPPPFGGVPSATPRATAPAAPQATATATALPTTTPTPLPTSTPVPPTPTSPPSRVISGDVRWTPSDSPVIVDMDTVIAPGATLTIEPGVDIWVASGARFIVSGRLVAGGDAGLPVRFVSGDGGSWGGIAIHEGGSAQLVGVQIRGAGSQGLAIVAHGGQLVVNDTIITEGSGSIVTYGSTVELRRTVSTGNSLSGAAMTFVLGEGNSLTLVGNSITGNQIAVGSPAAQIVVQGAAALEVTGNFFTLAGPTGSNLLIDASVPYTAAITCNTFYGGSVGLALNTSQPNLKGFAVGVAQNVFEHHTTRGASGDLAFDVANNWWGHPSGPFEATRNPSGQGDAVGVNLIFDPWLTSRPECAP